MTLNLTLSRAGHGWKSQAIPALFFTVKTAPARFTGTRAGAAKTRHAAAAALSSTRPYTALVAV